MIHLNPPPLYSTFHCHAANPPASPHEPQLTHSPKASLRVPLSQQACPAPPRHFPFPLCGGGELFSSELLTALQFLRAVLIKEGCKCTPPRAIPKCPPSGASLGWGRAVQKLRDHRGLALCRFPLKTSTSQNLLRIVSTFGTLVRVTHLCLQNCTRSQMRRHSEHNVGVLINPEPDREP